MSDLITVSSPEEIAQVSDSSPVRIWIFLFKQGEPVCQARSAKIGKIHHKIRAYEWDRARLVVKYGPPGVMNETECDSVEDFKDALAMFLEPGLLQYVQEHTWTKGITPKRAQPAK